MCIAQYISIYITAGSLSASIAAVLSSTIQLRNVVKPVFQSLRIGEARFDEWQPTANLTIWDPLQGCPRKSGKHGKQWLARDRCFVCCQKIVGGVEEQKEVVG